jgi:site-specific recombinase XerD
LASAEVSTPAKLGLHHFAYLRACAEGLVPFEAAIRYLGHDRRDGQVALRQAHRRVVDQVQALARRSGDRRWRLVGLTLKLAPDAAQTPLAQWAEERGLDDLGEAELIGLYLDAFPPGRKTARNSRLRARQLDLIKTLAATAAEPARTSDRIDAWVAPHLAASLESTGLLLLADLQRQILGGGRWWRKIPKVGPSKAAHLCQQLELLLPGAGVSRRSGVLAQRGSRLARAIARPQTDPRLPEAAGAAVAMDRPTGAAGPSIGLAPATPQLAATAPPCPAGRSAEPGFVLSPALQASRDIDADTEAVRAWVRAKAGSPATAKGYRRELSRFLLFLQQRDLTLTACTADDCLAYMALLQNIPPAWIGTRHAGIGQADWSPFAGRLSIQSQRQSIKVVGACLAWLVAARYLPGNPWLLVNRKTGDDRNANELASRAIEPETWDQIIGALETLALREPGAERMRFLFLFVKATGLRAAELLEARLGDFRSEGQRLTLQVHGKGSKNRLIPVTAEGRRALDRYLAHRAITLVGAPQQPLLSSLTQPGQAPRYGSLYQSLKGWLNRAIDGSGLSMAQKVDAAQASPHWLRHTCATRYLENGAPIDVVGQLLGHADPRTTARYTRAQINRVADALEKAST